MILRSVNNMLDLAIYGVCFCVIALFAYSEAVLAMMTECIYIVEECAYILILSMLAIAHPVAACGMSIAMHARGCFTIGTILKHADHACNIAFCIISTIYGLHTMYLTQQIVVALAKLWCRRFVGTIQCMTLVYIATYVCMLL